MFAMLCFGFLAFVLLFLLCDYLNKRHRNKVLSKSKIDGLPALPVLGNVLQMRGRTAENIFAYLHKRMGEQKIFRSWVFHQLVINTADPKDLAALLSSQTHITKNNVYDMLSLWLGDGLLMSTGKKWHTRRKIITPTFHFKILEEFVDIFDQQSTIMIERLATAADGKKIVDIFPVVCLMALDVIAETAMGVRVNAQINPNFGYVKAVKNVTELIAERLRRPAWRFDWLFRLLAPTQYNYLQTNIEVMKKFTNNVIQQRRTALQATLQTKAGEDSDWDMDLGEKKRQALLDVLLQSNIDGKPLSNEDIREEVETFMFEGHDTTTSGISFALYLISRHPDVQRKLYAEIVDVVGTDVEQPASLNQLMNLKYMESVIKESLRLFPPVPVIGRYFRKDSELNNKIIPANTSVYMPLFIVLRDPDCFDEPDSFKPTRFLGENARKINPFAFVPFSAGPRNCIGQKFAILEMKSAISKVLRHYELLPAGPEIVLTLSIILRSANGVNLALKPRNK